MPMTTSTEWGRARLNTQAQRHVIVKLTDGTSTWYFSDQEMELTDVGHVFAVRLNAGQITSGWDLFTKKSPANDMLVTMTNFKYSRDNTADGWLKLSNQLLGIRGRVAEVYFMVGSRMTALTDCLRVYTGTVIQQPTYTPDSISVRIVNKWAVQNKLLPLNKVSTAFTDFNGDAKMPIVLGEFSFDMRDFTNNLGLARAYPVEPIHDRKYIVADHVMHTMDSALFFKQTQFPLPSQMYETTLNVNDSGRGTATAISSSRRFAKAFVVPDGSDRSGFTEDLVDMVNLENALDLDVTTYATFDDYFDVSGGSNTLTGSATQISAFVTKLSTTSAHGFSTGDNVDISGTTNYDGNYRITVVSTTQFEIGAEYAVEVFAGTETVTVFSLAGLGVLTFPEYDPGSKSDNAIGRTADTGDVAKFTFLDAAAAVDKGGGLVGVPITGHTFLAGDRVTVSGTTNYDGLQVIASVSANEVVITATFVAETFSATDTMELRITYVELHVYANKDSVTMSFGYDVQINNKTMISGYTLDAWNLGEIIIFGGLLDWANNVVWQMRTSNNDSPVSLVVKHGSATGGDVTAHNQVIGRIHAAYLVVPYIPLYRNDHFIACKGAKYGSWITGRSSAYAVNDLIEDPAGMIEEVLRTVLGMADADLDLPTFISAESSVKARANLNSHNEMRLADFVRTIAEQSTLAFSWGSDGIARCIDLANKTPTTDRIIHHSHIKNGRVVVGKTSKVRNKMHIQSRWQEEMNAFADSTGNSPIEDTVSQGSSGVNQTFVYNAKWKNIAGASVTAVSSNLVNSTDGLWSKEHTFIEVETMGVIHADLVEGDWIELDGDVDPHILCYNTSWVGKQFIIFDVRKTINGSAFKAMELWA